MMVCGMLGDAMTCRIAKRARKKKLADSRKRRELAIEEHTCQRIFISSKGKVHKECATCFKFICNFVILQHLTNVELESSPCANVFLGKASFACPSLMGRLGSKELDTEGRQKFDNAGRGGFG